MADLYLAMSSTNRTQIFLTMRLAPILFIATSTALSALLHYRTYPRDAPFPNVSHPIDYSFGVRVPRTSYHLGGKDTYWLKSSAYAACAAGVGAPKQGGSPNSGGQATLMGVSSSVTRNGVMSSDQTKSTTYKVSVKGRYTLFKGFNGAVGGQQVADSQSQC